MRKLYFESAWEGALEMTLDGLRMEWEDFFCMRSFDAFCEAFGVSFLSPLVFLADYLDVRANRYNERKNRYECF